MQTTLTKPLLYRFNDLIELGVVRNRVTLHNWIKKGRFPRPLRIGENTVAWRAADVQKWLEDRAAESAA